MKTKNAKLTRDFLGTKASKLFDVAGDPDEFYADLQALEHAEGEMEQHASDVESLTAQLMADLSGLNITGG